MTAIQLILATVAALAVLVFFFWWWAMHQAHKYPVDRDEDALDAEERFSEISDSVRAELVDENESVPPARPRVRALS